MPNNADTVSNRLHLLAFMNGRVIDFFIEWRQHIVQFSLKRKRTVYNATHAAASRKVQQNLR